MMLQKIYKYTPLRMDFFNNLMIRASQKYALNDPFELRPGYINNKKKIKNKSRSAQSESHYYDYSVVSLSETNNNLLMWSHYAEQHKGIVIEFDASQPLFEQYKSSPLTKYDKELDDEVIDQEDAFKKESINAGVIQRVRYNSLRPSLTKFENILEHFLVKSDEWIYEKEHRIVLPLVTADRIIVSEKYLPEIEHLVYSPEVLEAKPLGNGMQMINLKEPLLNEAAGMFHMDEDYVSSEDLQYSFVESVINEYLQRISEDPTTVFLYKVPPKSIKSVFIGCRVPECSKKELLKKINETKELAHITVFQAQTSSERFELKFEKLTSV